MQFVQAVFVEILVVFANMTTEFAAKLVFICFAAAPPHRATPLGLVRPARPVEVICIEILCGTVFADFLSVGGRLLHL